MDMPSIFQLKCHRVTVVMKKCITVKLMPTCSKTVGEWLENEIGQEEGSLIGFKGVWDIEQRSGK